MNNVPKEFLSEPNLPKILWLEDDKLYVSLLREDFEQKYHLDNISTIDELNKIDSDMLNYYHAILIDMELNNGRRGIDVIKLLKMNGITIPILVLSNDETMSSKIDALGLGVDDYLWKAMAPEEMILRLENAILRGQRARADSKITFGILELDPFRLLVKIQNNELELSKIEFHLLMSLIKNHPVPLSCDYLRQEIWRQTKLENGTINTFIWKMNKKLHLWDYRLTKELENIFIVKK
jgi:DNA-binding response OmpR family regulator